MQLSSSDRCCQSKPYIWVIIILLCWVQDSVQADLAALVVDTEQPESAQFALNFLWLNKNIAVAVDQLFDKVITRSSALSLSVCTVTAATSGAGCICSAACKAPIMCCRLISQVLP